MTRLARKQSGFVTTPEPIARELVRWAVRHPGDTVLDLGAGEGLFLLEIGKRLQELGVPGSDLGRQVYGVEKDPTRFARAQSLSQQVFGSEFVGFRQGDLFDSDFPPISAIVGNPPYVRRASLADVDAIHSRILHHDLFLGDIPRLADLYAYFLIYAERFLVPDGRLAVVISSSWLDTRSGAFLKRFLLSRFKVDAIVACEARMFQDALVKSVLLLARKGAAGQVQHVKFVRLKEFHTGTLSEVDDANGRAIDGSRLHILPQDRLREAAPWSVYLRTPDSYELAARRMGTTLGKLVESRIGIQPLARDFFVLDVARAQTEGVDERHLQPIAYSPRHAVGAVIEDPEVVPHRILCTREPYESMDPALLAYVRKAEKTQVAIRGQGRSVLGYQNVPRLQHAGRQPWYNLADEIARRGRFTIFVPRRFYRNFVVVWNKAGVVAGENFIELRPKTLADTVPLLAILNSSFFEIVARSHAQQYGGGIFNLNPVDVRRLPVLNPQALGAEGARTRLEQAFTAFAAHGAGDEARASLDEIVGEVFGFPREDTEQVWRGVLELRELSGAAKRVHTG